MEYLKTELADAMRAIGEANEKLQAIRRKLGVEINETKPLPDWVRQGEHDLLLLYIDSKKFSTYYVQETDSISLLSLAYDLDRLIISAHLEKVKYSELEAGDAFFHNNADDSVTDNMLMVRRRGLSCTTIYYTGEIELDDIYTEDEDDNIEIWKIVKA